MNRERRKLLERAEERAEGRISIWHVLESYIVNRTAFIKLSRKAYFYLWVVKNASLF